MKTVPTDPPKWGLQWGRRAGRQKAERQEEKIQLDWQEDTCEKSSVRTCFQKRRFLTLVGKVGWAGGMGEQKH